MSAQQVAMRAHLGLPLRARGGVRCAFGETGDDWAGDHHCHRCADAVEDACRQFAAAVARGEYDAEGYTPAERQAQQRRRAA